MIDQRTAGGLCVSDLDAEHDSAGKVEVSLASRYNDEQDCIDHDRSVSGTEIELENVPLDFSFARHLSPMPETGHLIIINGGMPLSATHLVALALNQICRAIRKGAFYCLPQREGQRAHPCDIVYTNELWSPKGNARWDASSWSKRLKMLLARTQLEPYEKVIPVCLRIFEFHVPTKPSTPKALDQSDILLLPPSEQSDLWSEDTVGSPFQTSFPYATKDDPTVTQNRYQYSRRIEDLSTYIITFKSPRSTPFVCLIGAAEHCLNCIRFPTPNDLSETFVRQLDTNNDLLSHHTKAGDRAQELVAQGGVGCNEELVGIFREAFERDEMLGLSEPDQQLFGRVTYSWQEVVNRIEDHMYDDTFDMSFWPGAA